ncbi:hypothetical protein NEISICOT_01112 [Neisseria sicca ATCC 29256]|uniref:Uncharacterized protein n=2 Tax=Neisseria TaxID=482 RepID=A0AA36XK47_9NEIS|nr:hypothetical protein NEISICOT_01112 [Neisseria sicca ATCC 29256]EGQ74369.1 hypothetical protein HMPREF9418_2813 [Neisseria macacae ATCC 33926]
MRYGVSEQIKGRLKTLFSRFSDDLLSWAGYSYFNIMQSI